MELAAGIVWAFWNMVSPEKEEEVPTVKIELIGYEGDRIEKVGAKDMKKTDWDQCMAAVEDKDYSKISQANGLQESGEGKGSNFASDTYELIVKYEDGSVKIQPIDPNMAELVSI